MTGADELADFLRARLDEDEATAQRAAAEVLDPVEPAGSTCSAAWATRARSTSSHPRPACCGRWPSPGRFSTPSFLASTRWSTRSAQSGGSRATRPSYDPDRVIKVRSAQHLPARYLYRDSEAFATWLQRALFQIEEHESREWLRRDGAIYDDPHAKQGG